MESFVGTQLLGLYKNYERFDSSIDGGGYIDHCLGATPIDRERFYV